MPITCPTSEKIDDLQANRLTLAEAELIRDHLSSCEKCQSRMRADAKSNGTFGLLSPPRGPGEIGWLNENRIVGVLGEGGMSIVFDAEDTKLQRPVAIKALKPNMVDVVTKKQFIREGHLLAKLPHEHIVTVYAVEEANGVTFLQLEKLDGESLADRLKRDKWLPLGEALMLARQAAEGLMVAHEEGLVHRDIKPSNIWLEMRNGTFRRVKLIDFGVARNMNQEGTLSTTGVILGTPMYMAPEQAAGLPVDARADIYSLGCVLFEMLTGKELHAGNHSETMQLLQAIIRGELPALAESTSQLPPAVGQLLKEMLANKPGDRPPSARALVDCLRRIEAGDHSLMTTPGGFASSPSHGSRKKAGVVGIWIGVIALLSALIVSVVAAYYKFQSRPEEEENPAVPKNAPIKVGILHSQTGTFSVHERPIINVTQMAIEEINEAGGINGRQIEFHIEDGASNEEDFAKKARKLLQIDKVEVIFGCWTSSSRKRVLEECKKVNHLLFYPATHEGLEESPYCVYLGGTPNQTVIPLVEWAYSKKRYHSFYFVGSEYVYSHSVADILDYELKQLKGKMVGKKYVPVGESNFDEIVKEIKAGKPDMILNTIDGASNLPFFRALRAANIRPEDIPTVWFAINESELSLFRIDDMIGDYSAGCYFETLNLPENTSFLKRFRARFGRGERVNDVMQTAYFGVYLWKLAVEQAGTSETDAVRIALPGLAIDAPEGKVWIAKNLHAYRHAMVGRIEKPGAQAQFRIVDRSSEPLFPEPFPPWKTRKEWEKMLQDLYRSWGNKWEMHR